MKNLFLEENKLDEKRPKEFDLHNKLIDIYNELDDITDKFYNCSISELYDSIEQMELSRNQYISIHATNILDRQLLDKFIEILYKFKNPHIILNKLESILNDKISPLDL